MNPEIVKDIAVETKVPVIDNEPVVLVFTQVPLNEIPEQVNPTILKLEARLIRIWLMFE